MPCWYYDRRELDEMSHHGLDPNVVARYRKEGPRFILDCGGKMGLRYETCATGVVYFHRFYLFQSFKEFNRHVTASCCLFLAGKVEETPKKCKDIIKVARSMLTDQQFTMFGDDPREEVMTMERILLQTIKFDLQVEHPYSYLLNFAKIMRDNDENNRDRDKIQAMVQMAWTFINDSMCTLLCLQWEPDILAVALMYLASRLKTFDLNQKGVGKGKWWNNLVEDITFELLEDICHQVLDLYSSPQQKQLKEDSPPPPPPPKNPPTGPSHKRSRSNTPSKTPEAHPRDRGAAPPAAKISRHDAGRSKSPSPSPNKQDRSKFGRHAPPHGPNTPVKARPSSNHISPSTEPQVQHGNKSQNLGSAHPRSDGKQYNPYMSSAMYGASFMSGEGAQNIKSLMSRDGPRTPSTPASGGPPPGPPTTVHYSQPPPPADPQYSQANYQSQPPLPYQSYGPPQTAQYQQGPPPGPTPPYPPQNYQQPPPSQPPPPSQQSQPSYNQYHYPSYPNQPPPSQNVPPYPPPPQPNYPTQPPPPPPQQKPNQQYNNQPYHNPQYPPPPPTTGPPPSNDQYNYPAPSYQKQYKGAPPMAQGFPHGPPPGPQSSGNNQPIARITGRR